MKLKRAAEAAVYGRLRLRLRWALPTLMASQATRLTIGLE